MDNYSIQDGYADLEKLNLERNKRLSSFINKQKTETINFDLRFELRNKFWGNSWICNQQLEIIKDKSLKTSIQINSNLGLSEVWDCKVLYYHNEMDNLVLIENLDKDISIKIHNGEFYTNCEKTHTLQNFSLAHC